MMAMKVMKVMEVTERLDGRSEGRLLGNVRPQLCGQCGGEDEQIIFI